MASQEGISQDQMVDPGMDQKLKTRTIRDTLAGMEECAAFAKLIRDADLEYVLRRSGLHALLAPRNEAFEQAQISDAEQFLVRHLLPGGVESFDLRRCESIKNEAGEVLPVRPEGGSFRIGDALMARSDVPCTNGVIHVMDGFVAR